MCSIWCRFKWDNQDSLSCKLANKLLNDHKSNVPSAWLNASRWSIQPWDQYRWSQIKCTHKRCNLWQFCANSQFKPSISDGLLACKICLLIDLKAFEFAAKSGDLSHLRLCRISPSLLVRERLFLRMLSQPKERWSRPLNPTWRQQLHSRVNIRHQFLHYPYYPLPARLTSYIHPYRYHIRLHSYAYLPAQGQKPQLLLLLHLLLERLEIKDDYRPHFKLMLHTRPLPDLFNHTRPYNLPWTRKSRNSLGAIIGTARQYQSTTITKNCQSIDKRRFSPFMAY